MTTFFDSSALVKLYADEAYHEVVRAVAGPIVVSTLARVEVPSAIWRKQRVGDVSAEAAGILVLEFEFDWFGDDRHGPRFDAVPADIHVLDEAAGLAASHGLRAYDAVHLSTALAARRVLPECTSIAVFDVSLRAAAISQGFSPIPSAG